MFKEVEILREFKKSNQQESTKTTTFYINMKKLDLSSSQFEPEQWKFIIQSIFRNQGDKLKEISLKKCELNDLKVQNIIMGISLGLRQLIDSKAFNQ